MYRPRLLPGLGGETMKSRLACDHCEADLTLTLAYPSQQSNAGVHDVWDLDDGQSSVCHSMPVGLTARQALTLILEKERQ